MADEKKICARCKEAFPATPEFFGKPRIVDGKEVLRSYCPDCRRKNKSESYHRNKETSNKRSKRWYADNRDMIRSEYRERYQNDTEYRSQAIARAKQYYAENADERKAYIAQWQKNNPDRMKNYRVLGYMRNRDAILARQAKYKKEYPERRKEARRRYEQSFRGKIRIKVKAALRRTRMKNNGGTHTAQDILSLYDEQNGRCYYCGITLGSSYHVDHIEPISRGGSNAPDNLACTCQDCNLSKGDKTLAEWILVRNW